MAEPTRNAAQGDFEVDFVVVCDGEVTAIEVKSTGGVSLEDFLKSSTAI